MKKLATIVLIWFIVLNVVNLLSVKFVADRTSYELPETISLKYRRITVPWLNFDGRNYLKIALDGHERYYMTDLRAFFPLYPLLVRAVSLNLYLNPVLTGLAISLLSFVAALLVFGKLLENDKVDKKMRLRILAMLLVFPTSYYFMAFYTESLFLLLVVLTFYFLNKGKIFKASIFASLASATRVTGLALIVPLIWETWLNYKKTKKISWSLLLAPAGFFAYALYTQLYNGGAASIIFTQKNWNKPIGLLGPIYALRDGFIKFVYGSPLSHGDFIKRSMEMIEFTFGILLIAIVIYSYKKIKFTYWLYMAASILPIFFSGVLSSVHRYMAVMFPIYILVGSLPKKYFYVVTAISSLLLVYLASLFLRGYWVA